MIDLSIANLSVNECDLKDGTWMKIQIENNTAAGRLHLWNELSSDAKIVALQALKTADEKGIGRHGGRREVIKRLRVDCKRFMRPHHITAAINELQEYAQDLGRYA